MTASHSSISPACAKRYGIPRWVSNDGNDGGGGGGGVFGNTAEEEYDEKKDAIGREGSGVSNAGALLVAWMVGVVRVVSRKNDNEEGDLGYCC